jgi:CBS domain-containing protein
MRILLTHDVFDDEPTTEVHTLRALTLAPIAIVEAASSISELRAIFLELRVPAIAVVDADRSLLGLVTRTDVLRVVYDLDAKAADLMSGFVLSLPIDSTVERAAALMATETVGQIVVTEDGDLVGMVSALDIARHVAIVAGYLAA